MINFLNNQYFHTEYFHIVACILSLTLIFTSIYLHLYNINKPSIAPIFIGTILFIENLGLFFIEKKIK